MPGWSASEGRASVPVREDSTGATRSLPGGSGSAGTTELRFSYLPPHELPALLAAGAAVVVLLGSLDRPASHGSTGGAAGRRPEA